MSNNENAPPSTGQIAQQQQQQQQPSPSLSINNVQSLAQSHSGGDSLVCQWQSCGERSTTAEQLYDHVCERHVGRKSTNNLNLTCQWGNCRTTTVKRDHITSHIRVHVPLKPHKCDFCGKAFKRPQDLKKHVKTHADDSVLLRSPDSARGGGGVGYSAQTGKLVADLQSLAATASGYYPDHHQIAGQPIYYQNGGANASAYHGPAQTQQSSAYGPVYYAVSQPQNSNAEYELRKRAAFDALNEFFGEAKQRRIDPTTYYDVGHRLMALQNVQTPVLSSPYSGGGVSDYHHSGGGGVQTATQPQLLQSHYSLPLPNARTKNDLLNIDQFLEQLQSTVYENSNQAAEAGVAVHGTHVFNGVSYRNSHSPTQLPQMSNLSAHAHGIPMSSGGNDTPALTPASSTMSYNSAHSPASVHSSHTISPISRPNMGSMYPTLPTVSAMSEIANGYPTSSAPPSGLATAFDADLRRRYSGGHLQKEAPSGDRMDIDDDSSPAEDADVKTPKIEKLDVQSPSVKNVDPALRSPGMQSESSDATDKAQESWIENVRIIEALRHFVQEKLERGDYEEDAESSKMEEEDSDAKSLYPVLRSVREGA